MKEVKINKSELLGYELKEDEVIITKSMMTNDYYIFKIDKINKILKKNDPEENKKSREYYEIILGKRKVNLYFDIEYYSDKQNECNYNKIYNALIDLFDEDQLNISSASRFSTEETDLKKGKFKNSYHIVVKNEVFSNMFNILGFINNTLLKKYPELKEIIDTSVYTKEETKNKDSGLFQESEKKIRMFCSNGKYNNDKGYLELIQGKIRNSIITLIETDEMSKYDIKYETKKKDNKIKKDKKKKENEKDKKEKENEKDKKKEVIEANYDELKDILERLPEEYLKYKKWRSIGWGLSDLKEDKYRELFHLFSSRYEKYDADECEQILDSSNGETTIGTIYQYAKEEGLFKIKLENKEKNEEKYDENNYIEFIIENNEMYFTTTKYYNEFIVKLSKLIKYCPDKSTYICNTNINDINLVNMSDFEKNIKKYFIYKNTYKNGKQKKDKVTIDKVINDNISLFTVTDIIFDPNAKTTKKFNLYRGMIAEKYDDYDISKIDNILNHIKTVWSNNDEKTYKYIINWLAKCLRTKVGVMLCIIGNEGVGKNIVSDWIIDHIIGPKLAVNIVDIEKLTGKFNGIIDGKTFVILNEAQQTSDNYSKSWEIIKSFTTDKKQTIEKKYMNAIEMNNFMNLLLFSNNPNPIKCTGKDRRYAVFKANKKKNSREYFKNLVKDLNKENGSIFYSYLMDIDLDDFDAEGEIPLTDIKKEQIKYSLPAVQKWLYNKSITIDEKIKNKKKYVETKKLYQLFIDDCKREKFREVGSTTFKKEIEQILQYKIIKIRKYDEQDEDGYISPRINTPVYIFDLEKIKTYFKDELRIELEETEIEEEEMCKEDLDFH
jgi:hypothetical protein